MKLDILVVEDESIQAMALKAALEDLGHQVVGVASDGEEALALRQTLDPEMVIMDIQLPGLDGLAAAGEMNRLAPLPVVLMTAVNDYSFLERAAEAGVHGFLVKPVDRSALGPAIDLAYQGFERVQSLSREVDRLQEALRSRKVVERAKGIIMDRLKISEAEAMRRLQKESRRQRAPMVEIAESVISTQSILDPVGKAEA